MVGVIGEGTTKEVQANWESPFESDSVGSKHEKAGGLLQVGSDMTSVTTLNSQQVWSGNMPHTFNISLQLYALADPKAEVMDALMALEQMATPELNGVSPVGGFSGDQIIGRVPQPVWINIGRNVMVGPCHIENISMPLDGPRSHDGHLMEALVNLSIQTKTTLNRSQIAGTYG